MAEIKMDFDLPSNSDKSKKKVDDVENKKVDKVVTGEVRVKKRGFFKKFKKNMLSEDADNVGSYVVSDIIIPTVKDLIFDAIRGAMEMVLWGSSSGRKGRRNIPYNSISNGTYQYNGITSSQKRTSEIKKSRNIDYFDVSEVMMESRKDAENVLESLRTVLEEYPSVSIAEFYDTLGQSAPHTAYKYGWTNLNDADVRHCKDGYYIDFPSPKLIN